ncbi:Protein of unknown function (DUF3308) [Thiovulum sp. ES]|nr:Protein of unknown function (DUF3308) [Thiovulum sp. ES]
MKKLIPLSLIAFSSLFGESYEHYQIYKDPNTLRMGGAFIGVGGSGVAPFYNPAGLSTMIREDGAEVKILNLSTSINDNAIDIAEDFTNLGDIEDEEEQTLEAIRITKKNIGKNNHFEFSNYSYVANNISDRYGFAIGGIANLNADSATHRGFGSEGFATFDAIALGGAVLALSYKMDSQLSFGLGAKYLQYVSASETITLGKFSENRDNFDTYLEDELVEEGTSLVFDAGVLYSYSDFRVGLSALNIGGVGKEGEKTYIPETYNIGLGYFYEFNLWYLRNVKAGFDYTDITDEYKGSDFLKKTRVGFDATLFDTSLLTLKTGAGMYQGYPTAGVDLRLTIVEISFLTYAEEIGAYSGQKEDRRYLLNLSIGW